MRAVHRRHHTGRFRSLGRIATALVGTGAVVGAMTLAAPAAFADGGSGSSGDTVNIGTIEAQLANQSTDDGSEPCFKYFPVDNDVSDSSSSNKTDYSSSEVLASHGASTGGNSSKKCSKFRPSGAQELKDYASTIGVTPSDVTDPEVNQQFLLATVTHYNNTIANDAGQHFSGDLNLKLADTQLNYTWALWETDNDTIDKKWSDDSGTEVCPNGVPNKDSDNANGCADKLTVSSTSDAPQKIQIGDETYTLHLLGFSSSKQCSDTDPATWTSEQDDTSRYLCAKLTKVESETPPATDVTCTVDDGIGLYALGSEGQLYEVTSDGATKIGSSADVKEFNGLGIGQDGSPVYAFSRSGHHRNVQLYEYNTSDDGAWTEIQGQAKKTNDTNHEVVFVAGAVDSNGDYYFGGFDKTGEDTLFRLWKYDDSSISYVGHIFIANGTKGVNNGDIAFDSSGDLLVVYNPDSTTSTLWKVRASNLADAQSDSSSDPKITATKVGSSSTIKNVNGMAFGENGTLYLGAAKTIDSYTLSGSELNGGESFLSDQIDSMSDLASCAPAVTNNDGGDNPGGDNPGGDNPGGDTPGDDGGNTPGDNGNGNPEPTAVTPSFDVEQCTLDGVSVTTPDDEDGVEYTTQQNEDGSVTVTATLTDTDSYEFADLTDAGWQLGDDSDTATRLVTADDFDGICVGGESQTEDPGNSDGDNSDEGVDAVTPDDDTTGDIEVEGESKVQSPADDLAYTGIKTEQMVIAALILLLAGGALVSIGTVRRRSRQQ